jgi:hypothetical protein
MKYTRGTFGAESVASGLLVSGGNGNTAELYDEASGRWFTLPHQMEVPRQYSTVLLPC